MPAQKPRTILVVNDYEPHRYVLVRMLERVGFMVKSASTGADALQQATTLPDAIVLDVNLPDISGFEVCRRIRANPDTCRIPVVFLSAERQSISAVLEGEAAGGGTFLFHPVDTGTLVTVIEGEIARAASQQRCR